MFLAGSEKALEARVAAYCRSHRIYFRKWVSPGHRGVPDRIVMGPGGKILFLEFKRLGARTSPCQAHEIRRLKFFGFPVEVVDRYDAAVHFIYQYIQKPAEDVI